MSAAPTTQGAGSATGRALRLPRAPKAVAAAVFTLAVLVIVALLASLIRPLDANSVNLAAILQPPSAAHPMGTDENGRDLLARVIHGLRVSFAVAAVASLASVSIGGIVGVLAGAVGGWVDGALMRVVDLFASQNHLLFGVLLAVLFRPVLGGAGAVMLAVGLTHWPTLARLVRGELLSLRERPFVAAAIGGGAGRARLARRHFIPHLLPTIALGFVLTFPHAIFHESALSFLGIGLSPDQASLGNIIADGQRSLLAGGWWVSLFPGVLILLVTLSVGTVGEYLRDRWQPRWRSELEL